MKSLFFKGLAPLLFTVALFATINTFGMEQQEENLEVTQEYSENSDTVAERMYNALSKQLEERFPKAPTNFYEAIVQLKCIAALLEKSEIQLRENFDITQDKCTITTDDFTVDFSHKILHPIFNHWFKTACNKILLEHPKSVEAAELILKRLGHNVSQKNLMYYQQAINSLHSKISERIKYVFSDNLGWPYGIQPEINLRTKNPYIIFMHQDFFVFCHSQIANSQKVSGILIKDFKTDTVVYDHSLYGSIFQALSDGLINFFHIQIPEDGVFPHLWQQPNFEHVLHQIAQVNV